ncbi:thioredoxin, partial [Patescibacteria group bacterium]|nr:thioredoxin [Patescibacteria group bacterium]
FVYVLIGVGMILVIVVTVRLAQDEGDSNGGNGTQGESVYNEVNEAGKLTEGMVGITGSNFDEVVTNSEGVVVVDFFAPSCSYCVKFAPIFAAVFEEYKDQAVFGKFDVTKDSAKITSLEIGGTPETIIFKDGEVANKVSGFVEAARLKAEIDKVLAE